MRAVRLPTGKDVILSDTVGFISDLPTQLIAAFRATLEEVLEADLIVHVRDIAHPESEEQARNVRDILADLGVGVQTRQISLWNKADLLPEEQRTALQERAQLEKDVYLGSAVTGEGLEAFFAALTEQLDDTRYASEVSLSFAQGRVRAWLFAQGVVDHEKQDADGYKLQVTWTDKQKRQFRSLLEQD